VCRRPPAESEEPRPERDQVRNHRSNFTCRRIGVRLPSYIHNHNKNIFSDTNDSFMLMPQSSCAAKFDPIGGLEATSSSLMALGI